MLAMQQQQQQQPYPFAQPTFTLSNQFQYSPYGQTFYPTFFASSQNNSNPTNNNTNSNNSSNNNSSSNSNAITHTMNGIPFTYANHQSSSIGPKPTGISPMFLNQPTSNDTTSSAVQQQQQQQQPPPIQTTTSAPAVMSRGQSAAAAAQKKRPRSLAEETEELKVELKKLLDLLHEKGWKRDANGNFYNDEVDFDPDDVKTSGNLRLLDFGSDHPSPNNLTITLNPDNNTDTSTDMNTSNL